MNTVRTRNLRTIGALAALFLMPLALSFWMYYGVGWHPAGRTNHGELLQPALPLPHAEVLEVNGRWYTSGRAVATQPAAMHCM